jgi:hypothetical protein
MIDNEFEACVIVQRRTDVGESKQHDMARRLVGIHTTLHGRIVATSAIKVGTV